jgi:hypothetical protein
MMVLRAMDRNLTLIGPVWQGVAILKANHCGYPLIYPGLGAINI